MRVLLTGVNATQCGHVPKLSYISAIQALRISLEGAGHNVDVKPVELGANLAEYDKVVVFLASMRGFVCVHTLSALWAIYAAQQKCVISFDDWQIRESLHGIKAFAAERDKILSTNPFGYKEIDHAEQFKRELWTALDLVVQPEWAWPVLIPAYHGGDLTLLSLPKAKLRVYNPSILFKGRYGFVEDRLTLGAKEWILAALHDHRGWLKKLQKNEPLSWPVVQYGHRRQGQERVVESELYQRYTQSMGVLSPAYKICGSGWWRARYGLAADALAIAAGDPAEMAMVDAEVYPGPKFVESGNDTELLGLAYLQREAYYKAAGTPEQVYQDILAALG